MAVKSHNEQRLSSNRGDVVMKTHKFQTSCNLNQFSQLRSYTVNHIESQLLHEIAPMLVNLMATTI